MRHLYEDKNGILHRCELTCVHPGIFLCTTICGIDVPANESFKSLETPTCKSCKDIEVEDVYDCPVHGTAHGGRGECPLC